jgi:hypothetical protein
VCTESGFAKPQANALKSVEGQIRWFPINCEVQTASLPCTAPHGQVDKNGNLCAPTCTPDKYDIVGFQPLRIVHVCTSSDACWSDAIGQAGQAGYPSTFCAGTFPFRSDPDHTGNLALDTFGASNVCPDGRTGVQITNYANPFVYRTSGPNKIAFVPGWNHLNPGACPTCDYDYDSSTYTMYWNPNHLPGNNVTVHVDFTWFVPAIAGVPGYCNRFGNANPSAWCLYVQYEGPQFNNSGAGGGYDFGARGIGLVG